MTKEEKIIYKLRELADRFDRCVDEKITIINNGMKESWTAAGVYTMINYFLNINTVDVKNWKTAGISKNQLLRQANLIHLELKKLGKKA